MASLTRLISISHISRHILRQNICKKISPKIIEQNNLTVTGYNKFIVRHESTDIKPDIKPEIKPEASAAPEFHSIIKDTEKAVGDLHKHEFQADTQMLLDTVARSLYSEKEVFVRELISNASDALEKFRYERVNNADLKDSSRDLEIHIGCDKTARTLTIQDTGIGMTKDELIENLGTIARSGSKAFLEKLKNEGSNNASNIIGQFGVGFYSAFMVADKVDVYTKSSKPDSVGLKWTSDGSGSYEIQEAEGVQLGTKIIITLKPDCREYADDTTISNVIKKYSNFVGNPIYLNGQKANNIEALWLMEPKDVKQEQHNDFYRFIANSYDKPRFVLHYKTDVPLSIRSLLYFPEGKPGLFDLSREQESGVALYSRKVLIKNKTDTLLPKWLRFIKGVVDSEDIPLNLSRELLQNSALIRKLRTVITNRILRFLHDQSVKNKEEYDDFYTDYSLFLKEGIIMSHEQLEKEEIGKLLRFESSSVEPDTSVSLAEYCSRMKEGQKDIYYLEAPNRILAEGSPYFEALKKKGIEVLFCFEPYDEIVLMQLKGFLGHTLTSVEKDMHQDKEATDMSQLGEDSLKRSEVDELIKWIQGKLSGKVFSVKITSRLDKHPCVVTVEEMAAARHFIRTQSHQLPEQRRYALLQPQMEINAKHPLIKKLHKLTTTNPQLADLVIQQLFSNAMVGAGLVLDPRTLLTSMNELLTSALEKH